MVQTVHLEKQNIIIIYVETQNDYERALKYLAGTKMVIFSSLDQKLLKYEI